VATGLNDAGAAAAGRLDRGLEQRPGHGKAGRIISVILSVACLSVSSSSFAGNDDPFEIDHRLKYDNHGNWSRKAQLALEYGLIAGVLGLAVYEGSESRLNRE